MFNKDIAYNSLPLLPGNFNYNKINFNQLINGLSHTDFPLNQPSISEEVFFINITKKIIFNMYDDRGLDVISLDKKLLEPVYNKFNDWILGYDKEEIDKLFK